MLLIKLLNIKVIKVRRLHTIDQAMFTSMVSGLALIPLTSTYCIKPVSSYTHVQEFHTTRVHYRLANTKQTHKMLRINLHNLLTSHSDHIVHKLVMNGLKHYKY